MLCLSHHYYGWLSPYPQKLQNKTTGVWQNSLCQQVAWPIICFVTRPDSSSEFESFFISQVQWDQNGGLDLTPNPFHNGSLSLLSELQILCFVNKSFGFFLALEKFQKINPTWHQIFFLKADNSFVLSGFVNTFCLTYLFSEITLIKIESFQCSPLI